jgi:ATP-dependent DNA helicase RecG
VDNSSLRQLIGLDTLGASQVLRRLRDRTLLELHPAGPQSFYTLDSRLVTEKAPYRGELPADRGELPADRGEFQDPALKQLLLTLGTRPRKEKLRLVIGQLCAGQWRSGAWLAQLLKLKPRNLADRHLSPMVKDRILERRFPHTLNHPEQAYRTISTGEAN